MKRGEAEGVYAHALMFYLHPDRFVLVWKMAFNLAKHLISIHRLSTINL